MSVVKAGWTVDYKAERWLEIKPAMPWRLFRSTSGRVWDVDDAGCGATNVVRFGPRRVWTRNRRPSSTTRPEH